MIERRSVHYADENALIADIHTLRQGYRALGQWTLEQICYHCCVPLKVSLRQAKSTERTQQQAMAQQFVEGVANMGWPDQKLDSPDAMVPPANPGEVAIAEFVSKLREMAGFPHEIVDAFFFGPMPITRFRRFVLNHAAHHFAFLKPTTISRREGLKYESFDAIRRDIAELRKGCTQAGNWNLKQACWHLAAATRRIPTLPVIPATPEQLAKRPVLDAILSGAPRPRVEAPSAIVPPPDADESAIDDFLDSLELVQQQKTDVWHPAFGPISADDYRKLALGHAAHHFSHFRAAH